MKPVQFQIVAAAIATFLVAERATAGIGWERTGASRDILLVALAVFFIVGFLSVKNPARVRLRPVGRRVSDLAERAAHKAGPPHIFLWRNGKAATWRGPAPQENTPRWRITLLSIAPVGPGGEFGGAGMATFPFAASREESERIIAPIIRKIFGRYRHEFEHRSPIAVVATTAEECTLTWVQHEAAIRSAVFGFLEECLEISNNANCRPCLEIGRGPVFFLTVSWTHFEGDQEILKAALTSPALEVVSIQGGLALRLWLSYEPGREPAGFQPGESRRSA